MKQCLPNSVTSQNKHKFFSACLLSTLLLKVFYFIPMILLSKNDLPVPAEPVKNTLYPCLTMSRIRICSLLRLTGWFTTMLVKEGFRVTMPFSVFANLAHWKRISKFKINCIVNKPKIQKEITSLMYNKRLFTIFWPHLTRSSATRNLVDKEITVTHTKLPSLTDMLVRTNISQPKQKSQKTIQQT